MDRSPAAAERGPPRLSLARSVATAVSEAERARWAGGAWALIPRCGMFVFPGWAGAHVEFDEAVPRLSFAE
jgi:hypothetical protein